MLGTITEIHMAVLMHTTTAMLMQMATFTAMLKRMDIPIVMTAIMIMIISHKRLTTMNTTRICMASSCTLLLTLEARLRLSSALR